MTKCNKLNPDINSNLHSPGKHLLLDLNGAVNLTDVSHIEKALLKAAEICGAKVIGSKLHSFGDNQGVTGVVLLAESHISIHTWPETGFVAIDIFMCGDCNPSFAIDPLKEIFQPEKIKITEIIRG